MMQRRQLRNLGSLISIGLFVVAVIVIHQKLRGHHYHDIVAQIHQVPDRALLIALTATFLNYLVLTAYDALGLRYIRHRLPYHKLALASFIGYVFSNNAGIVGGSAARYYIYSSLGVRANEIAKLVLFCGLTFWLGLLSVGGFALIVQSRNALDGFALPFYSLRLTGIALLVALYMFLVAWRRQPLILRGWELAIPSVRISAGQIAISSLDWLLSCFILYVLLPSDAHVGFREFSAIFVLAQGAGLLSHVPGGLGVFETVGLLLLGGQGDVSGLAVSFLLFRIIYYIVPLAAGAVLLAAHEVLLRRATVMRLGVTVREWGFAVAPSILAMANFISGAVLLFSGVLPAEKGRMAFLRDLLPLPAIEISHFMGSLAGAALLILARGLQRRLDVAYHLTAMLLGAGVVLSLLKGLDYEEAIILTVMLAALLPCRACFYRKASLVSDRFTPLWIALTVIILICSIWLVFFSYQHVVYSNQLWWKFAFESNAPRSLRATAGAIAMIGLFAFAKLLVPGRPKPTTMKADTIETIRAVVKTSKKTYAYLALVGDKQFLFNDSADAFIMYAVEGQSWVAMGDPVGEEDHWEDLAWRFVELCDRYGGQGAFYQVDVSHLDLYTDMGMVSLKLGEEAYVHLPSFSLEGSRRKGLRHSCNRVSQAHHTFRIAPREETPSLWKPLVEVSDAWLAEKHAHEKGFSMGVLRFDYISQCPLAVVESEGKVVAFANLWMGAQKQELSVDLMRYLPSCPDGVMDYLFSELMLWGKDQGYQWFNLGMAPLSGLDETDAGPLWSKVGTLLFRHGEHFYNFQGLRGYKKKFDPEWRSKYLVCKGGLALPRVLSNIARLIYGDTAVSGVIVK
jgi:phosphatidylglycerol lysyltransferase